MRTPQERLSEVTRTRTAQELARGLKPAAVRQLLLQEGISVTKANVKSVQETQRDSLATLVEELQAVDGVSTVAVRYNGVAGLFVSVILGALLTLINPRSIRHVFLDGTRSIGPRGTHMATHRLPTPKRSPGPRTDPAQESSPAPAPAALRPP